MKLIIVLALAGLAIANLPESPYNVDEWEQYRPIEQQVNQNQDINDRKFASGREYRFFYDGQSMTGAPGSSRQHSGSRVQAVVVIQMPSEQQMRLQLESVRMARVNKKVNEPRRALPYQVFEPVAMDQSFKAQLEKPVEFQYADGLIKQIKFDQKDETVSRNMKRAALNLLQLNLKEHNSIESSEQQITNNVIPTSGQSKAFRVMEETIEGECETLYAITKLPSRFNELFDQPEYESETSSTGNLNITKSINFQNCDRRPMVKYNYRNNDKCESCDELFQENDNFVKSSSVMRYNLAGNRDQFLIESVEAESQYVIQQFSEESTTVNVYVNQTLRLFKSGPVSRQIQMSNPSVSQSGLVYSQQWDVMNEKFLMEAEGNSQQIYKKQQNFVEEVTQLIKSLARVTVESNVQPIPIQATSKFSLLVSALRTINKEQMEQIHQKFIENSHSSGLNEKERKFVQQTLESAAASAGTEVTLHHVAEKIEAGKLSPATATSTIKQMTNARVVSKKIIEIVKRLANSEFVLRHPGSVKPATYLALGSVMKAACSNQQEKLATDQQGQRPVQRCSHADKKSFVQFFIEKMQNSDKWEDQVLMLKSLGNAALDVSFEPLEKIIHNSEKYHPSSIRYEAITALRQLVNIMPTKVQQILLPIYMNPRESASLRQVAAFYILRSHPESHVLSMMAKQINQEPMRVVAQFTHQLMSQLANSTNPCEKRMSDDLKLALQFTKQVSTGLYGPHYGRATFHNQLRKLGLDVSYFTIAPNNSFIPRIIGASIDTKMFSAFTQDKFMVGLNYEAMESLNPLIWNEEGDLELNQIFNSRRHPRSVKNYGQQMNQLMQQLNQKLRQNPTAPKAFYNWMFNGQDTGYFALNKEVFDYLVQEGYVTKDGWKDLLSSNVAKHVSWYHTIMMEDSVLKIPTSLGLPLIVKHKTPVVMKIDGSIKPSMNGDFNSVNILANLRPSIAMKIEETVELWNPMTPSGFRVRAQLKAQMPLNGKLEVDISQKQGRLVMNAPTQEISILDVRTQPITFTREPMVDYQVTKEAEEQIVLGEEVNRRQQVSKEVSPIGQRLHYFAQYTPAVMQPAEQWMPIWPLSGPNKFILRALPATDNTKEIELKLTLAGSRKTGQGLTAEFLQSEYQEESESNSESSEEIEKFYSSSQSRFGEMILEVSNKGSSKPQHYKMQVKSSGSLQGRFGKLSAKLSQISPNPSQICLESEILYPSVPFTSDSVQQKKIAHHSQIRWGSTCQANNFVQISSSSERTSSQLRHEQDNLEEYQECKSNEQESPIACYEYIQKASYLNKHTITIKYSNVPASVQNVTEQAFRALKAYNYWNTDVATVDVRNAPNQIRAVVRIDAENLQRMNITVKSPKQNVTMLDLWTSVQVPRLNVKSSFVRSLTDDILSNPASEYISQIHPVCRIRNNHIKTFDGQDYQARLNKCYSLVAKDCSQSQRFAVLVKNVGDNNQKRVKIMTQNSEVKIVKNGEEYKVQENGQEYSVGDESSAEMYNVNARQCYKTGPYVKCTFNKLGLRVYFDGSSVNVKLSPTYIGKQCGLCGHMNLNPEDDFQGPDLTSRSDIRQFMREYTVKDSECEAELPEMSEMCSDENCEHRPQYRVDEQESDSYEIPTEYQQNSQLEPRRRNKVFHRQGKTCFSKQPISKCPSGTKPTQAERQEIEYTCLDNNDFQAHELVEQARRSELSQVQSRPTEFSRDEMMHTSCERHHNRQRF